MAEYTETALQTVDQDQNILFSEAPVPCTRGWVIHRAGSGIFKLRGLTDRCSALYRVQFTANIAMPDDAAAAAPISVALALEGEPIASKVAVFTPAAAGDLGNVSLIANVRVPRGCCANVSVVNTTTPDAPITVQNATIEITRAS